MAECPWCEEEVDLGFEDLCTDYECPHCHKLCEVDDNYSSIGNHHLFLIEHPEQIKKDWLRENEQQSKETGR